MRSASTILVIMLLLAGSIQAQEPRIGYVDMKQLLDNAPQVVAGRDRLDIEFRDRNDALENDQQRLDELQNRLQFATELSADERLRYEQESRLLQRSIERRRDELRQELQLRRNEEISRVEADINAAISSIARDTGYDLIVASPVVYASERIDITQRVLDFLQREYAADQAEEQDQP
ncbi:MAG: hypothetical protein Tsb002_01750 [Wenzhouxiangellaceae bacterium]